MSRRVSLPAADDLFRPTSAPEPTASGPTKPSAAGASSPEKPEADSAGARAGLPEAGDDVAPPRTRSGRTSGRVRHDEKMTVYITSEELLEIEHARLTLRRTHGLAVDRGRLVRQAVALALADLEEHGEESPLVQRLRES